MWLLFVAPASTGQHCPAASSRLEPEHRLPGREKVKYLRDSAQLRVPEQNLLSDGPAEGFGWLNIYGSEVALLTAPICLRILYKPNHGKAHGFHFNCL